MKNLLIILFAILAGCAASLMTVPGDGGSCIVPCGNPETVTVAHTEGCNSTALTTSAPTAPATESFAGSKEWKAANNHLKNSAQTFRALRTSYVQTRRCTDVYIIKLECMRI